MQTNANAKLTEIATFTGRDGDAIFNGAVKIADLDLTDGAFVQSLVELAASTLLHRKGTCAFKSAPSVVDAAEFTAVVKSVGTGGGRFKVSKDDTAEAAQFLKDLANLGATEKWEAKHGVKATIENIAPMFTARRAEKAKAEADAKAAERKAMLGLD